MISELAVESFGSFPANSSCFSELVEVESAKIRTMIVFIYVNLPFFAGFIPGNTFYPRRIVRAFRSVAQILRMCSIVKVFPPIITSIKIAVVNLIFGPHSGHVEPCEVVGAVTLSIDHNHHISLAYGSGGFPGPTCIVTFPNVGTPFPTNDARLRIIIEDFQKVFVRDRMLISHLRGPFAWAVRAGSALKTLFRLAFL